jgi:hypothetical protein
MQHITARLGKFKKNEKGKQCMGGTLEVSTDSLLVEKTHSCDCQEQI